VLAAEFPKLPEYRRELAISNDKLGLTLRELGQHSEAEAGFRAALKIQEELVAQFRRPPNYSHDLAPTHYNFGSL
jgi:hypothetical protein